MFQMKVGGVFLELLALCLDLACVFYFFNFAINIPCFINAFVALHIMPIYSQPSHHAISFLSPY
jgi:hypothetical protein